MKLCMYIDRQLDQSGVSSQLNKFASSFYDEKLGTRLNHGRPSRGTTHHFILRIFQNEFRFNPLGIGFQIADLSVVRSHCLTSKKSTQ